jgi:hypothetical protein
MRTLRMTPKGIARQLEQLAKSIRSGRVEVRNVRLERSRDAIGQNSEELTIEVVR